MTFFIFSFCKNPLGVYNLPILNYTRYSEIIITLDTQIYFLLNAGNQRDFFNKITQVGIKFG